MIERYLEPTYIGEAVRRGKLVFCRVCYKKRRIEVLGEETPLGFEIRRHVDGGTGVFPDTKLTIYCTVCRTPAIVLTVKKREVV